ncbi:hypothetical protein ACFVYA_13605 [Amycolatopsis sp. NPDC058278]|uniref:hypothetical protein n=1 Tax=Amycolatopsis sp. NPDC058278 TaxID=3346417 RepID=UPI0036DE974B
MFSGPDAGPSYAPHEQPTVEPDRDGWSVELPLVHAGDAEIGAAYGCSPGTTSNRMELAAAASNLAAHLVGEYDRTVRRTPCDWPSTCADGILGITSTEAAEAYRAACRAARTCSPEVTLRAANAWAEWASSRHDWAGQAVSRSAAAIALHRTGRAADVVVRLEWGRARLLSEVIAAEQVAVDALRAARPDLADRYQAAVEGVTRLESAQNTRTAWRLRR